MGTYLIEIVVPLLFFLPVRSLRLLGFWSQVGTGPIPSLHVTGQNALSLMQVVNELFLGGQCALNDTENFVSQAGLLYMYTNTYELHLPGKGRPRCYTNYPLCRTHSANTAPGLIGVTGRLALLSHGKRQSGGSV